MTYLQAIVIALVQGVTELFPISSLGHSVLLPAWIGGSWQTLVTQSSQANSEQSFYLAFIVALHCATALALLWFFRADWVRIIRGFFRSADRSVRQRKLIVEGRDERLAWMIVVATIPVGLTGVALEHTFRTLLAKPLAAAVFLTLNGVVLLIGERLRRRSEQLAGTTASAAASSTAASSTVTSSAAASTAGASASGGSARTGALPASPRRDRDGAAGPARTGGRRTPEDARAARASDARIARLGYRNAAIVGLLQISALFAGISRSGVTMVGGLWRGLDHEDSARFAFLLATPPILAAGFLKLPSLAGPAGQHIHGQTIVGAIVTAVAAYLSVRFLVRWFKTRTLTPFAIYCLVAGLASIIRFA